MKGILQPLLALVFAVSWLSAATIQNPWYREIPAKAFTKDNITYIPLQGDMIHPNSAWGSVGVCKEGFVYIIVCNHISDSEIFEYNTQTGKLFSLGKVSDHLALKLWAQRQPKVHTQVVQNPKDGLIYFATDAGDRSEGLYDQADEGYWGSTLCTLDPKTKEVKNLGLADRHAGAKTLAVSPEGDAVYMNLSNGCRFVKYDIKTRQFTDYGRINGRDVPRTLFTDKWGNVYNATESSWLVRYNPAKGALEHLDTRLPGCMGPSQVAYGPNKDYVYMVCGYTVGDVYKYTFEKDGPGKLDSLAIIMDKPGAIRNLNESKGRLYAVSTAREVGEGGDSLTTADLIVFDPVKRAVEKRIRMDACVGACYGGPNMDKAGNCYIAAFAGGAVGKMTTPNSVHLVKFNPAKL